MRSIVAACLVAIGHGSWKKIASALASSCLGLILMLSCYKAPTISQGSASDLSVFVGITDHYPTALKAELSVGFSQGGQVVALSGKLSMACDGIVFPPVEGGTSSSYITLPRQPDGGAYHCVYTDENGKRTPLTVPTPQGSGQIISPAPNSTIHLIGPQYDSVNEPRPAGMVNTVTIRYTLPTPPAGAKAFANAVAECGPPYCLTVYDDEGPATGTIVLTDAHLPYGEGFETFPAGTHELRVNFRFEWSPPAGGFQQMSITYSASLSTPVTWSRA